MLKIIEKIRFKPESNRMKKIGDVKNAIEAFKVKKNKNLFFLLNNRFSWMKNFIDENEKGLEVGAGAGFSKYFIKILFINFIKNKDFLISDVQNHNHLDLKNIDAQNTKLDKESFDFIIASNMLHHVPFPLKFLNEMHRILKPGGKLIMQEAYCSLIFQLITIIMKHEGFDFTKNVWSDKESMSDIEDPWAGNIAVPHLIFDDKEKFKIKFQNKFSVKHDKIYECIIFLNSGGVTSKTYYLPMNSLFLKFFNLVDKYLVKVFPKIFGMGRQIVLQKF